LERVKESDAKRFEVLYRFAGLAPAVESTCLDALNSLLSMECQTGGVQGELKADGTPTMWEVIYHKYMRSEDRRRGIGKIIAHALDGARRRNARFAPGGRVDNPPPAATGPTLVYAARNWAVHGMLLTSFFRGSRQKYIRFIENITLLLSAVLDGAAQNFLRGL
jgi:hypothetical protein